MTKESKNVLSRETVKKDLTHLAKADLVQDIVLLAVMLLIFVPLAFLSVYAAKFILILGVVLALVCAVPIVIFACRTVRDAITLRLIKNGGFSVEKDTVSQLSRGEIPRKYSEGRHTVDVIYFTKYGRYVSNGATFELSSVGDEFYLVILRAKKEKLVLAFNTKIYEYN